MSKKYFYSGDSGGDRQCYGQSPNVVRAYAQREADKTMQVVTVDYEVVHRDNRCTETGTAFVCHPRKFIRAN